MDGFDAQRFATEWIDAWNARDIDRVVSHFAVECEFQSPKAAEVTGDPIVRGRDGLRAYWGESSRRAQSLRFTLDRSCGTAQTKWSSSTTAKWASADAAAASRLSSTLIVTRS